MANKLSASLEDYLEAILEIGKENKIARVKDIAKRLKVTMPSVHGALKQLKEQEFVRHDSYGYVELTSKGEEVSKKIARAHEVLRSFLKDILKLSAEASNIDACQMEHCIGPETLERMISFLEFVKVCPKVGEDWLDRFDRFCKHGIKIEKCASCVDQCLIALNKMRHEGEK